MGIVTCDIAISVNGFVAGSDQRLEEPFGDGIDPEVLHGWMFGAAAAEHAEEIDAMSGGGAYIMGRNMFGPDRGEWDLGWKGWWDGEPPFRAPVFVLCHRPRESLVLDGIPIRFVTDGPARALELAQEAAGDRIVGIAGGAATIDQYLRLGAIEILRLHVTPQIVGAGARLMDSVGTHRLELLAARPTSPVVHLTYRVHPSGQD